MPVPPRGKSQNINKKQPSLVSSHNLEQGSGQNEDSCEEIPASRTLFATRRARYIEIGSIRIHSVF